MVRPTTYFLCLSLFKLHLQFIFMNGEDLNPIFFFRNKTQRDTYKHHIYGHSFYDLNDQLNPIFYKNVKMKMKRLCGFMLVFVLKRKKEKKNIDDFST